MREKPAHGFQEEGTKVVKMCHQGVTNMEMEALVFAGLTHKVC